MKAKKYLAIALTLMLVVACLAVSAAAEGNVAKIGDTEYDTLAEAVAAAQSGETVLLLKDVTVAATAGGYNKAGLVISGITLDGDGHTLTVTGANTTWDCAIYTQGGTIKNVSGK